MILMLRYDPQAAINGRRIQVGRLFERQGNPMNQNAMRIECIDFGRSIIGDEKESFLIEVEPIGAEFRVAWQFREEVSL